METRFEDYFISTDKQLLNFETILQFLADSYWGNSRTKEVIKTSIANSICYGVYDRDRQIGFARVITDGATAYWLCDVYIDREYRGKGIGSKLVEIIVNDEPLKNISGYLGTADAHSLYEKHGFVKNIDRLMLRRPL